ncbi:MAG: geranylgeranylglycerol-phosphate geranylgeranyltransferase [Bacteroidota bacterium]
MKLSIRDTASFLIASRVPNLLIIAIAQFFAAYCLLQIPLDRLIDIKFGLFLLSTGMIGAGGYIINDYFDQKIDMINRPQHVIVGTNLKRRFALLFHTLLTAGGIILGFMLDPFVGAIHIFSSGALWMYSGILKRQLLIGTLTISFLTSLSLLILMVYFLKFNTLVVAYSMFGCVTIFIRESVKDIISVKGETAFGVHSVPIIWGIRGAKVVILLAGLVGICMITFYLLSISNWTIRYFFMTIFLVVLWAFYRLIKADRMKDFEEIKKVIDIIITLGLVSITLA